VSVSSYDSNRKQLCNGGTMILDEPWLHVSSTTTEELNFYAATI
jgi:hypothetical protein